MARTLAISFLAVAFAAVAFIAGRASAPGSDSEDLTPMQPGVPGAPSPELERLGVSVYGDPHNALLQALALPAEERKRATRMAIHAWLAASGASALRTAREEPRLAEVVDLMVMVALVVDPDIFIEDPALLEGFALADQPLAADPGSITALRHDLARAALSKIRLGGELGIGPRLYSWGGQPMSLEAAYREVESLLAERSPMERQERLSRLVSELARSDPAGAAALVDSLPEPDRHPAVDALIGRWAQSDPEAAANWLGTQQEQILPQRFTQLAQHWGMQDFDSASAFAATLSVIQRQGFLEGLATTIEHLPNHEKLMWIAGLESEPSYPNLAARVATLIAREDAGAAMSVIESLPPWKRQGLYAQVVPNMVIEDPEAALAGIDAVDDPDERDRLATLVASLWTQMDPDRAVQRTLALAPGPVRDRALASVARGLASLDDRGHDDGALEEVRNPASRRARVAALLRLLEDEDEAIRLGSRHGFDRQAVLEVRADST